MKPLTVSKERRLRIVYITLLSLVGVITLILLVGTGIGLARPKDAPPLIGSGKPERVKEQNTDGEIKVFSGLGRLRIPLSNSSILIISIAFPYPAGDIAFTEELASKINEFKVIATDYFAKVEISNLGQINEETAKTEILKQYNAILRLGRISTLYFSDMMIIDASLN